MTTHRSASLVVHDVIKRGKPDKASKCFTELWCVRHGETDWNRQRRLQGWQDIPLNGAGYTQAHALAARIGEIAQTSPFAALYSSPLARAVDTAKPCAERLGLNIRLEPSLRERCFGVLEGIAFNELAQRAPEAAAAWRGRDPNAVLAGGESLGQFQARILNTCEVIAQRHPHTRVLIVTHGGALDIIWRAANQQGLNTPPPPLPNVGINRIGIDGIKRWQMLDWADVAHLQTPVLHDSGS